MIPPKKVEHEIEEFEDEGDKEDEYDEESSGDEECDGDDSDSITPQKAVDSIRNALAPLELDFSEESLENEEVILKMRSDDTIMSLVESTKEANVPITLDLSCRRYANCVARLSVGAIILLADAIKGVRYPFTLYLDSNLIGDEGVKYLASAIIEAKVPITLNLYESDIGMIGLKLLAEAIEKVEHALELDLGYSFNIISHDGVRLLSDGIKSAKVPLTLHLENNNIGDKSIEYIADAIKKAKAPLTLNLENNDIGLGEGNESTEMLADAIKKTCVPLHLWLDERYMKQEALDEARNDNFVLGANSNSSTFLSRIKFSPSKRLLEQALGCPSVLAKLVQEYIGDDDLAWLEVAAIRAVEGASHENKYASINYELLAAAYPISTGANVARCLVLNGEQMVDDSQDVRRVSFSDSSSSQSQILNLLLLLSRIKALSNRLEVPQGYVDVPGDGLCFYHAIARQLGKNVYDALALQQMAIDEIINHLDRYEGFIEQYGGGLNGFLNYHLQRQDSEKGGWADNIMIQALANALERVIEVQLFDRAGNAIGADPVVINPHNIVDPNVLRIGNLDDLHFVAAAPIVASDGGATVTNPSSSNAMVDDALAEGQIPIARPLKRKQEFAEDSEANKAAKLEVSGIIQGDEVDVQGKEEVERHEEEIDWDQYRCEVQDGGSVPITAPTPTVILESSITSHTISQVYYEVLEL